MTEFTDMTYHWMKSLSRLLKITANTRCIHVFFLFSCVYTRGTIFLKIQSGSTAIQYKERRSQKDKAHCIYVYVRVHPCVVVHTSLDNDHNPLSTSPTTNHNTFITRTTQKPLFLIRPICKLLCSDRPSQQHFNNLNTISIIHLGSRNKKEIAD